MHVTSKISQRPFLLSVELAEDFVYTDEHNLGGSLFILDNKNSEIALQIQM